MEDTAKTCEARCEQCDAPADELVVAGGVALCDDCLLEVDDYEEDFEEEW